MSLMLSFNVSRQEVVCEKAVYKNIAKFIGKRLPAPLLN